MKRFHFRPTADGGWIVQDNLHNLQGECKNVHEAFMLCRSWQQYVERLLHPDPKVRNHAHDKIAELQRKNDDNS